MTSLEQSSGADQGQLVDRMDGAEASSRSITIQRLSFASGRGKPQEGREQEGSSGSRGQPDV